MNHRKTLTVGVLAMALLGACSTGEGGEPDPTETGETSQTPEAPAESVFVAPSGTFEDPGVVLDPALEFDSSGISYAFQGDVDPDNRFFVTTYELDAKAQYPDYDTWLEVVREYDALVGNEAKDDSHFHALVGREPAISRYTIIPLEGEGILQQQNYFVFRESELVQITCQWSDSRELVLDACHDLQKNLTWSGA